MFHLSNLKFLLYLIFVFNNYYKTNIIQLTVRKRKSQ